MRFLLLALAAVALAACPSSSDDKDAAPLDDAGGATIGGGHGAPAECAQDTDCVLSGASCCACPSFAIPVSDPGVDACDGVTCPAPTCADNVQATCSSAGTCELTCAPLRCETSCANGYALDPDGCLTCTCAASEGCGSDADCQSVPADCCGCARGGSNTAVDVADVNAQQASLMCAAEPLCPGSNTCDRAAEVRCFAQRCYLLPAADQELPANTYICGRPDLQSGGSGDNGCPGGEVCKINTVPAATAQGVGVCQSP